jgi:hypothetical protein
MHRHPLTTEVSDQLCECGCGEFTMVSPRTNRHRDYVKGRPRRFVNGHQARARERGPQAPCACGCGELVPVWRKFVLGHGGRRRSDPWWTVEDRGFETPCWVWTGSMNAYGYPIRCVDGRWKQAHRLAFVQTGGVIPAGCIVHHCCEVPLCVNPEHLAAVAQREHQTLHAALRRKVAA